MIGRLELPQAPLRFLGLSSPTTNFVCHWTGRVRWGEAAHAGPAVLPHRDLHHMHIPLSPMQAPGEIDVFVREVTQHSTKRNAPFLLYLQGVVVLATH